MATTTTNLGLTKPDAAENYDVGVFNGNADTLDAVYGEVGVALDDRVKRADFDERAAVVDASLNSITQEVIKLTPESGTWTVELKATSGAVGGYNTTNTAGTYFKVGKKISLWGRIGLTSVGTLVGGLYIPLPSSLYFRGGNPVPIADIRIVGITLPTGMTDFYVVVVTTDQIRIDAKGGGSSAQLQASYLTNTSDLIFSIDYLGD